MLEDRPVRAATLQRYCNEIRNLLSWTKSQGIDRGTGLDLVLCDYFDHLYYSGEDASLGQQIMADWEKYSIVRQVRNSGLLMGVSFNRSALTDPAAEDWWAARAVRGEMLQRGVWAISDHEDTIRLYPALNMQEETFREGLEIMEAAIREVENGAAIEGDGVAFPTGVAGF